MLDAITPLVALLDVMVYASAGMTLLALAVFAAPAIIAYCGATCSGIVEGLGYYNSGGLIARHTQRATVRNLTVAARHTFYVIAGTTPILVHNIGNECDDYRDYGPTGLSKIAFDARID